MRREVSNYIEEKKGSSTRRLPHKQETEELFTILRVVSKEFNIPPHRVILEGDRRFKELADIRAWISYIALQRGFKVIQAGAFLGKHHTTIISHIRKIKQLMDAYPLEKKRAKDLETKVRMILDYSDTIPEELLNQITLN